MFIACPKGFTYNQLYRIRLAMSDDNPRQMLSGRLATIAVIVGTVGVALAIRIVWPYPNVFVDGDVWFRGMDAWYHMRLVDSFVANFPYTTAYDPYTWFPHGIEPPFHPLTGWLVGGTAMLFGGSAPSPHAVDVAGAVFPAVLGSLTVIPAYFIGRRLFGPLAGAVGAIVLAIAPGEFLSRTLLGFTDHHVSEAFFSAMALMCLVIAIEKASAAVVRLSSLRRELTRSARPAVVWTALAGVSLGMYLLAWRGGLMVLLILFIYTVVRGFVDYFRDRPGDDVILVVSGAVLIGAIMSSPLASTHWTPELFVLALVASGLAPIVMKLLSLWARSRGFSPKAFVALLLGCGGVVVVVGAVGFPAAFKGAINAIDFMIPTGSGLAITEMQPLLFPHGEFSTIVAWTNFTTALPASLIGLVVLWRSRKSPRRDNVLLFAIWSITMLSAVLSQRRFGYYYMLNASVLTGFLVAFVFQSEWCRRQLRLAQTRVSVTQAKNKATRRTIRSQQAERRGALLRLTIVALAIVGAIAVPCVEMAHNFAVERSLMTPGWWETLNWMRENTPEPLEEDAYYALYEHPGHDVDFDYPDSAYSIMAWWDYGHWLTKVSQRIPVSNPFQQGASTAARYLLSRTGEEGAERLEALDARYVVLDARTSARTFDAVTKWDDVEPSDFYDIYSQRRPDGALDTVVAFYPEYYETMLVRLFNFSGEAFQPGAYNVIGYADTGGLPEAPRLITALETFDTYDEAMDYIAEANDEHVRLVSADPLVSCVALEALEDYAVVYESHTRTALGGRQVPEVKVIEYLGP